MRSRILMAYPDSGGIYGIKRYSVELARAMAELGEPVRLVPSLAKEWVVFGRRVGGLVTRRLAPYKPLVGGAVKHATTYHVNPRYGQADVVTVHDVLPVTHRELWGTTDREHDEHLRDIRRAVRDTHVITVSQHVKDELVARFDADPARITPVHVGVKHEAFYPDPGPDAALRPGKLNVLLQMSTEPRKRVDLALEAALELPFVNVIRVGSTKVNSVGMAHMNDRIAPLAERLAREGRYAHVEADDARLRRLYSSCDVFLHPSQAEGFGAPPVEALACGARVLASDLPAHREVLGAHARFFELSAEGIARALEQVWDGHAVREDRFAAPDQRIAHAKRYTYEEAARQTMQVYARVKPRFAGASRGAPTSWPATARA